MSRVELHVNGRSYTGWKAIQITRSLEVVSSSFRLDVSEAWGQQHSTLIAEGDAVRASVDDETVIDGYIDRREPTFSSLSFTGRDKTGDMGDSSVLNRTSLRNQTVLDVALQLAEPFGVKVSVQAGLEMEVLPLITVNPGDKALEVINRAAKMAGVLVVSDGEGGLLLTRTGTEFAEPLVEGTNMLDGKMAYDFTGRFYRYVGRVQVGGTDAAFGGAAATVEAEAFDEALEDRPWRVKYVRPEQAMNLKQLRRRLDWEARRRAAKGEVLSCAVKGWRQRPDGPLWAPNLLTPVVSAKLGLRGPMLTAHVELLANKEQAKHTRLRLMRSDAFTPEPQRARVKSTVNAFALPSGRHKQ